MIRLSSLMLVLIGLLAACQPAAIGPGGSAVEGSYRIGFGDKNTIQLRMVDSVNALRSASGLQPVGLESRLTAAAATHSRDMANQNRPWHFGSDGSSPLDRVQRAGYDGELVGEVISETFETELETLGAWMGQPDTRRIIMSPEASQMGFSWYQESNGKIWWTLLLGSQGLSTQSVPPLT